MSDIIERDYSDIYSVKDLVVNKIMPNYFPDMEPSNLTAGMTGMVAEAIGTITEDNFNVGSTLVAEAFPARAKLESSIYSNAAIFQLSDTFAEAASCQILLAIPEDDIINNFQKKYGSNYSYFYIDKNTKIGIKDSSSNAKEKIFILDYDIEIRAVYRESEKGWVYNAKYINTEYKNSVAATKDPYIRLKNVGGVIVLYLTVKQYEREEKEEPIIDNIALNYSTLEFSYSGMLLGFDILYKKPSDTEYSTQLEPRIKYSTPSKNPFCYYKLIDDSTIEISFTTKDGYFQPEFNSDIKIILYTTTGPEANFDAFDGNLLTVYKGEKYEYENSWILSGKILSPATGGKNKLTTEELQMLTVENFSTATSLTTEHDLQLYFSNYEYRYNNKILFIKKRNDAVELLFSAFMYIKKDDYIYPTNTLTLDTNLQNMDVKYGNMYNINPGYLFSYKEDLVFYLPVYYYSDNVNEVYDEDGHYYLNGVADSSRDITKDQLIRRINIGALTPTETKYYKMINNGSDVWNLYNSIGLMEADADVYTTDEIYGIYESKKFKLGYLENDEKIIDFMIDEEKELKAKEDYYKEFLEKKESGEVDGTFISYMDNYTFSQYKIDNGIDNRLNVFEHDFENSAYKKNFMFTNPFLIQVIKDKGIVSFYQTFVNNNSILDFVKENNDDAFVQFITYTLNVSRDISIDKIYNINLTLTPSIQQTNDEQKYCSIIYNEKDSSQFIQPLSGELQPSLLNFNKELLSKNDLRVILSFKNGQNIVGYCEMIPVSYNPDTDQYKFEINILTDDFITRDNLFQLVHKCPHCGHTVVNSTNYSNKNRRYYCDNCNHYFNEGIVNIKESDSLLLPITDLEVEVHMLYKDPANATILTNNDFAVFDDSYEDYIWTNLYSTYSNPLTIIKPLDMVRSTISYKDYYTSNSVPLDCTISALPLLKYSILAYKDKGMTITDPLLSDDIGKFDYFMDSFLSSYNVLSNSKNYLGGMNIDAKFYNTYGKSTNFVIGDQKEIIDTNNISISFDVWLNSGFDLIETSKSLKIFIKDYIETINSNGSNNLYISNLIREIEKNFAAVHHLRFNKINNYDSNYYSIENVSIDLDSLTKDERKNFVPDILVINKNNIYLEFYQNE